MACGCNTEVKFDGVSRAYRRVLWAVIVINLSMFFVEVVAGQWAGSQALWADALDFLGDSATYSLSLLVIGMPLGRRAAVAMFKGMSLAAMGFWVLASTVYQVFLLDVPVVPIMGGVGLLALAANLVSVLLLMRYRNGDSNVRSVWLCSRNDAIGNIAVLAAAFAVAATGSAWPDLIVAAGMASLFLWSSVQIVRQARGELDEARIAAAAE